MGNRLSGNGHCSKMYQPENDVKVTSALKCLFLSKQLKFFEWLFFKGDCEISRIMSLSEQMWNQYGALEGKVVPKKLMGHQKSVLVIIENQSFFKFRRQF